MPLQRARRQFLRLWERRTRPDLGHWPGGGMEACLARTTGSHLLFLLYTRPLFRLNEIACNHLMRVFMDKRKLPLPPIAAELARLNAERISLQGVLSRLGDRHGHVCAECKGKCCKGTRERDSFIDRVSQDPQTGHLKARRTAGQPVAFKLRPHLVQIDLQNADRRVCGGCAMLTTQGCQLPYDLRPIQCASYFCMAAASALTAEEAREGMQAVRGLMRIQRRCVRLAIRARWMRSFRNPVSETSEPVERR
jgi:hypothetical protein